MEYERTKEGLIQADLAKRLGTVLKQYSDFKINEEKFEVSLTLAILQNLLTNCMELLKELSKKERRENPFTNELTDNLSDWGISNDCININTFEQGKITYEKIFRHLRNALSHPTNLNLKSDYLSTGYTTENNSKAIEKIILVSSPDVRKNRLIEHNTSNDAKNWKDRQGTFPKETAITEKDGKYIFTLNSQPFYRVCKIELRPKQLLNLTFALSTYLSHPLQKDWDGKTFKITKIAA